MTILVTWQLTITVHCSHMQWGSKFVQMGTQWGLIFEWNGDLIETCDIWDTDYNTDDWEPGLMTIFVTWQLIVTLDSIRNSCDVSSELRCFCGKSKWFTDIRVQLMFKDWPKSANGSAFEIMCMPAVADIWPTIKQRWQSCRCRWGEHCGLR